MSLKKINTRKSLVVAAVASLMASAVVSCNDDSVIGSSIVQDDVAVVIDSTYTITGQSVKVDSVISRTITQIMGIIDVPGYGRLKSDVVTQFMPAISIETENVEVDYADLVMYVNNGAYTGDSIAPMGIDVYRLTEDLNSTMYSNYNPEGKYNPTRIGTAIYNATALGESDTLKALDYRIFAINLDKATAEDLFNAYKADSTSYSSPTSFAKVFKGLYFKNSFGSGRITRIDETLMRLHYHTTTYDEDAGKDTTVYSTGNYYAVTPEIVTNNNISLTLDPAITAAVEAGENLIVSPAGLDVEIKLPVREMIANYKADITHLGVINSVTMKIPAEEISNDYGIEPPENILMVLKSKKDSFFKDNEINDDVYSFYATYSSSTNSYIFSGLRDYLLEMMEKDEITDDDITFVLTPVEVETETTSSSYYTTGTTYVTAINPYVDTPTMVKLLLDETKIWFVYSKEYINN